MFDIKKNACDSNYPMGRRQLGAEVSGRSQTSGHLLRPHQSQNLQKCEIREWLKGLSYVKSSPELEFGLKSV